MSIIDRLRRFLAVKPEPVRVHGTGHSQVIVGSKPELDEFLRRLVAHDAGIKPPDDPSTEGWSWAAWSMEMQSLAFPGWSPCRFAHRTTPSDGPDQARFVFGLTRGPFGLWEQPFIVCGQDDDGDLAQERTTLTCLTHLPTGMGLGIFNGKDSAALAADTAMRACPNWPTVDFATEPGSPWVVTVDRIRHAWTSLGIIASENAHAHDPSSGGGPYAIMGLASNLEAQKPEKLS